MDEKEKFNQIIDYMKRWREEIDNYGNVLNLPGGHYIPIEDMEGIEFILKPIDEEEG